MAVGVEFDDLDDRAGFVSVDDGLDASRGCRPFDDLLGSVRSGVVRHEHAPAIAAASRLRSAASEWPYTSVVTLSEEWPSRRLTNVGSNPDRRERPLAKKPVHRCADTANRTAVCGTVRSRSTLSES